MACSLRFALRPTVCRQVAPLAGHRPQIRWSQSLPLTHRDNIPKEERFLKMYRKKIRTELDYNPTALPKHRRFGLVVIQDGYISEQAMAAMKAILKRVYKCSNIMEICKFNIQLHKKAIGKRAGGGKGPKIHKLSEVKSGDMIVEWDHTDGVKSQLGARRISYCIAMESRYVFHGLPPLEQLQEDLMMGEDRSVEEFRAARIALDEEKALSMENTSANRLRTPWAGRSGKAA